MGADPARRCVSGTGAVRGPPSAGPRRDAARPATPAAAPRARRAAAQAASRRGPLERSILAASRVARARSPAGSAAARPALSSIASASAACSAKAPSRFSSSSEDRPVRPRSSTDSTPSVSSSPSSGATIIAVGTYPDSSATPRAKRGSFVRSSTTIGSPVCATVPAIPWPSGNVVPTRRSAPSPETASKRKCPEPGVEHGDRRRLREEDRPRDVGDRLQQRACPRGSCRALRSVRIAHAAPSTLSPSCTGSS